MGSNGLLYVAAAYGVLWVVLFIYLVTLHQRVANMRARLESATKLSEAHVERKIADEVVGMPS